MPNVNFKKTKVVDLDFRLFIVEDSNGQTHKIEIDKPGGDTVNLPTGVCKLNYILTGKTRGHIDVDRTHGSAKPISDRFQIRTGHTLSSFKFFRV